MSKAKQGHVKAVPAHDLSEGSQVIYKNKVYVNQKNNIINFPQLNGLAPAQLYAPTIIKHLSILVVEFEFIKQDTDKVHLGSDGIKIIPLKYSQWQAAIDNNEVDNDKPVNFEITSLPWPVRSQNIIHNMDGELGSHYLAKIIPSKIKHDEGLFFVKPGNNIGYDVWVKAPDKSEYVLCTLPYSDKQCHSNALFITKTTNCHNELIEALIEAKTLIANNTHVLNNSDKTTGDVWIKINDAINKATNGTFNIKPKSHV